ncbi:hypothetical protein GCM10009678_25450 [Actinomadura kijaniata]|uniref:hypothetical protein n=1 Tax=Actinomadura kijaniata TaxID=46161 RepID=UPI002FEC27FC
MSTDEVFALMRQAGELPYGEARTVMVEDALRRAEATGDEVLAFRVRVRLTDAYRYGGEPVKAFATFSRTLSDFDRDPARFDEEHALLWQMKATVHSLTLFPEIPLDRTHAVLDDMERRYLAGGHSLQAVYHYRNDVALHLGDLAAADEWYLKWRAAPRDELSDCAGCDPSGMVWHLASLGRHADAFEIAAPVLNAELSCREQPQGILTSMLPVYLATGRLEEARDAHRRAYRLLRPNLADLGQIAEHVEFCATTGNEARGLEILQRHLGWLDRAPHPYAAMNFAAAGALLLRRLAETGHADLTVRRPASADRPAADVPAKDLQAALAARAEALAARFDARNGTSRQGDRVRAILDAGPVVEHLPLTPADQRRRTVLAAEPAPRPEPEPVDLSGVTDPDALLEIAEERRFARDMAGATAAWRRFDEVAADPTPLQRARRLDGRGTVAAAEEDAGAALAAWEEAERLLAGLGEEERRHRVRSRVGAMRCALGDLEGGLPDLRAAVEYFDAHSPEDGTVTGVYGRLATAHLHMGNAALALPVLDRAAPDGPEEAGEIEDLRGRALLELGRVDEAVGALRRALDAYREAGEDAERAQTALLLSRVLGHLAQHAEDQEAAREEVLAALDEAVAAAPARSLPRFGAHAERGALLLNLGRAADAVADLVEAVAGFTAAGEPGYALDPRVDLAACYLVTERHLEAAETAEEALAEFARTPEEERDRDNERRCRVILAHAQRGLDEPEAADLYAALARECAEAGDHVSAAQFLDSAGELLTGLDKDAQAAEAFEACAHACAAGELPFGVVQAFRRAAMCHLWSREPDRAAETMERARAALADLPPEEEPAIVWEAALVDYDQARITAERGDVRAARRLAASAVEGFTRLDETGPAETAARLRDDLASSLEGGD